MNKLQLDLETLEVEHLDVTAIGLISGLESLGMGHAATELSQSCANSGDCSEFCNSEGMCENASCVDPSSGCSNDCGDN